MTSTSNAKRFILLGDAGGGKSSFINFLYNFSYGTQKPDEVFCDHPKVKLAIPCANWSDYLDKKYQGSDSERDINDQTQSQTQKCNTYSLEANNIHLEIIDTPGFNDTNGTNSDEQNMILIEQTLKGLPSLTGIIFVINGAVPRLGVSFKNFLRLSHQVWPNNLLNNCVVILTNCDELSVNLDPSVVLKDPKVDHDGTFYFQNSLFRWDPKNQSPKAMCRFRQDFQDNIEKIDRLLYTLLQMNDVSTESFQISASKVLEIEECVRQSINNIINLLEAHKKKQIAQDGIKNAQYTMESNKEWEKHRQIKAFRWVEVQHHNSSSLSESKSKSTRQSTLTGHSITSSQMVSPDLNDHGIDMSNFSKKPDATFRDDTYHNQQATHTIGPSSNFDNSNMMSSTLKKSRKTNNNTNFCSSSSQSKNPNTTPFFCNTRSSYPETRADDNGNKPILSRSSGNYNDQQVGYSTKSRSDCSQNREDFSLNNTNCIQGPVYQRHETKIQVTIPDNEAQSHHDYAQQQEYNLQKITQELEYEREILSGKIISLLQQLKQQVAKLRSVIKDYDIIEKNHDLLLLFQERIKYFGDNSEMIRYYDETINILSKK